MPRDLCRRCRVRPGDPPDGLCFSCWREARDAGELPPRPTRRGPAAGRRDPESVRMVTCSECNRDCLGESEAAWALRLSSEERAKYPPLVGGRDANGRPLCVRCWRWSQLVPARAG